MRTVLITGATGTVGRDAVRALLSRGDVTVRALVRDPSRAALTEGVVMVKGDLRDAASVDRALEGVSAALYVSPHEPDEEALADAFTAACAKHDVRVVFVGVHADGPNRLVRALARAVYGMIFGHYAPKFRLSERVRQRGPRAVVLMPTNFFQNDELVEGSIASGEYPLPLSAKGVNRVDTRDLGEAIARALTDDALAPGAYPVVGPASLSGAECAMAWTRALGRAVTYTGEDMAAFERLMRALLTGKKRDDIIASYRVLAGIALPTAARDVARTTGLLGRAPRGYDAYVRERAEQMRAVEESEARG